MPLRNNEIFEAIDVAPIMPPTSSFELRRTLVLSRKFNFLYFTAVGILGKQIALWRVDVGFT